MSIHGKSLVVLAIGLLVSGCAALGLFASDAAGVHSMPALYVPPQVPTLVLVENDRSSGGSDPDCDRLARFLGDDLSTNKVAPLVNNDSLLQLRQTDPDHFNQMSIAAIGRSAGARQVIYVAVVSYGPDGALGSDQLKWEATVKVRVVDAVTGESRWPLELSDGEPVKAETYFKSVNGETSQEALRDDLNRNLAAKIGQLFHTWLREQDTPADYDR